MLKGKYKIHENKIFYYGEKEGINFWVNGKPVPRDKTLLSFLDLREISKENFGGFYSVRSGLDFGQEGMFVLLNPFNLPKFKKYSGHHFHIPRFGYPLEIEISTGKNGKFELDDVQREKYFSFVNDVFCRFMENKYSL